MQIIAPPHGPRMLILSASISDMESIFQENIPRATEKRKREHRTGRWLLQEGLKKWGFHNLSNLEVRRTKERAPYLQWIEGTWQRSPLPDISISHCENAAVVCLIESGFHVGIDIEPSDRTIQTNAFDMMAKGEELEMLRIQPEKALEVWTKKEAIQKAKKLGMHMNPREINLNDLDLKLVTFTKDDLLISIAWQRVTEVSENPEDLLIKEIRSKMLENPEFKVGC
ncbi:MAG TPA: 4'-phosphopantetheinyl transferase superfamily protein [Candidatus Poseidoniales archaeon]|nr:MAG TPA: 4'-phosphopantetheinyl transferase superfamily protein [Candidatus Poseidoniales archaeon]|tara:strand:+ start:9 stop:686 length:678 start_codon:yes stop_codon:yes gene_type:complete